MKIYHGIEDFKPLRNAVVTSGTFDGVHLGHQQILKRLREVAGKVDGETVLITFWPHPRLVLFPDQKDLLLLNTFEEKAALLREFGIEHLLRIPFTREFSKMSSDEFIRKILVDTIGTKKLVIGYDHKFGKNREGSFEHLKQHAPEYGFEVEEIPRHEVDHLVVSSTKIRHALLEGDMDTATELLGRPYGISGRVVRGQKIGRILGFPTANIEIDHANKLIPSFGAYAVKVMYEGTAYNGMMNIGMRPTVGGTTRTLEVNIFDFDRDIYGDTLNLQFIARIRSEIPFPDIESLKKQLLSDKEAALKLLTN
ncbi:bifunctional riboflavin kinase/FAD synthetase [Fulvivirga sedimenti]|uniref:Riboflavin biosynthesis protein n=1 Tax=Fulvivirga sedimenti TaxID=2879465 RepID=A0A9X1HJL3_9BACT|nr:bifunctional riboflavin kinase/FAD synthetase [Fulvivirga sedimenti]MCA6073318.1 bifunctional riboflavin kinase/FAD synthetase [Fulvivirga sedimenti]